MIDRRAFLGALAGLASPLPARAQQPGKVARIGMLVGAPDPVGQGLVASLARPGRNVTGTSALAPDIIGKQLHIPKGFTPGIARVAVLSNPSDARAALFLGAARTGAQALAVQRREAALQREFGDPRAVEVEDRAVQVIG